jgi:hypothetical protein
MLENNWSATDAPQRKQENFQPQFSDYVSAPGGCRTRSQTANDSQTLVNNGVLPVLDFTSEDSTIHTAGSGGCGADNAMSSSFERRHGGGSRENEGGTDRWDGEKGDCSTAAAGSDTGAGGTTAAAGSDTRAGGTTAAAGSDTGAGGTTAAAGSDTGAGSTTAPAGSDTGADTTTAPVGSDTGADTTTAPVGSDTGAGGTTAPAGSDTGADTTTAAAGSDTGAGSTPAPVGSDTGAGSTPAPVGSDTGAGSAPAPIGSDTGAGSTPAPVGNPIDANGATVVYNNGTGAWLNQDFDYNAVTDYNATPTSPPPDGASHVATTTLTGPSGGFQPYAPGFSQPITGDHYLNFSLNTNGQALSNFNVYAMKVGDIATGTGVYGNLAQYETSSNSNGWNTFSVPIDSALGLQGENSMYKFAIQDSGGTTGDSFQVSGITLSPDQKTA